MSFFLSQIPPLPNYKTGWPWNNELKSLSLVLVDNHSWPKISIITPSFNQGQFLEETIRSVLMQGYPNLEYIIIDGGSSDNSVEIIKKYEQYLTFWVSEPDKGQADAINKGFARATGDWLAWINSDDYYLPGCFLRIARTIAENPNSSWIVGTTVVVDSEHRELERMVPRTSGGPWHDYVCVRQSGTDLPQPSSFWSRPAWLTVGKIDESLRYAMDYEYWSRLARYGFAPFCIQEALAAFRRHDEAKTSEGLLPFWREEMCVIDKWIKDSTALEKDSLVSCRYFILNGIRMMERELFITRINSVFHRPFRALTAISVNLLDVFKRLLYKFSSSFRFRYWEGRAADIDEKWGRGEGDFLIVAEVISSLGPKRILDVGCGSGRLFPLYDQFRIQKVVGQDIATKALQIAKERYRFASITVTNESILSLDYPMEYFDLIVSNRVLQHVSPKEIGAVLKKLTKLGKHLYINELTDSDDLEETFYMHRHDYCALLARQGFIAAKSGKIGLQNWYLFARRDLN